MLAKEDIDIVSIGMRHPEYHEEIVTVSAEAGKHIFCEKPLTTDLASADRMLEACRGNDVKLSVAMQNRMSLQVKKALAMIGDGQIGTVLSLRGRGKEDHRGGGEDLMVLGYHILDLMRLFSGDPQWVFAQVMENGRDMARSDAHEATEPIGPVAGDRVTAMYEFQSGVHGYFESHRGLRMPNERFNLEIHGSEGIIALRSLRDVMVLREPVLNPARPHSWRPVTTDE